MSIKHKFINLPLDDKEIIDLLELLAEEIDRRFEKEYDEYRARLQKVYDRIIELAEVK